MNNPENTEKRINAYLAEAGSRLSIGWDGEIVGRDDPAWFHVYHDGSDTPFVVADIGPSFLLHEIAEHREHCERAEAVSYRGLVKALRELETERLFQGGEA